jgi:hypothetical protein
MELLAVEVSIGLLYCLQGGKQFPPGDVVISLGLTQRLCGLVARVFGYRSGGPGSIPGTTKKKKSSGSGTGSTQPREYN